jgi:phosphatidylethanolamine-binding protein
MLDIDVPQNGSRTTLLHWMAPDVDLTSSPAKIATTAGARYLQPNPPAGDYPHRYVFLLFAQPNGFIFPTQFANIDPPTTSTDRVGFSLTAFAAQAGLGMPLSANYIRVQNSNGTATMTLPPIHSGTGMANGTVKLTPPSATSTRSKAGASTPVSMAGGLLAGLVVALI